MRLLSLAVRDWRNLAEARLETRSRFVVLAGDNGQGKTNVLEAAGILATLRSFRESRPARWVRHGRQDAEVRGEVQGRSGRRRLLWRREAGRRVLEVDGAAPPSLDDWFSVVRAVHFVPDDVAIVRGEPEWRRRMLDRAEFTARPDYLGVVRDYGRVQQQKAALLRAGRPSSGELDIWDRRLVELGARVAWRRRGIVEELRQPLADAHDAIAGGGGAVDLELRSVGSEARSLDEVRALLASRVAAARSEEVDRGRVLVGPHRDDLDVRIDGHSARTFGSQGQVRTLVLALRLAELEAARRRGEAPLFLLDDLAGELDSSRISRLLELLSRLENQVWITTTDAADLRGLPEAHATVFRVRQGRVLDG